MIVVMMTVNKFCNLFGTFKLRGQHDLSTDFQMLFHDFPVIVIVWPRFKQHRIGDANFSNVMKRSRNFQNAYIFI